MILSVLLLVFISVHSFIFHILLFAYCKNSVNYELNHMQITGPGLLTRSFLQHFI